MIAALVVLIHVSFNGELQENFIIILNVHPGHTVQFLTVTVLHTDTRC